MNDKPSLELAKLLNLSRDKETLLIADENTLGTLGAITQRPTLGIISNRFDVAEQFLKLGISTRFCDFEFDGIANNSIERIFYRVSKEKPVVHHLINQAYLKLVDGGQLIFCGHKKDGTKSYFEKAKQLLGGCAALKKNGDSYTATVSKKLSDSELSSLLDDKNYPELRPILQVGGLNTLSKPGLFGWDKIDRGSKLLIEQLPEALVNLDIKPASLLDLGCGFGYLTLASRELEFDYRCATDNNAAALIAAKANFQQSSLKVDTIAADCADSIDRKFDLILCNPPFHQGFSVNGDLTSKFLAATHRLLSAHGAALLVVNQFVPIERKAQAVNFSVTLLINNGSFKVVLLSKGQPKKS
jgi:16S rRNA (guanine1207-N2)-methyltransferase|tara:strand:+ start:1609 stop:2679 length:1071 start_codon:yes stop_codon:yes gene_type:complete